MDALPVNLLIENRLGVVVGGGKVALRKCQSLMAAGARVRVVSPELCPELERLVAEKDAVTYRERPFKTADIQDAALVFACANDRSVNLHVLEHCRNAGIICSCVDGNWVRSDFTSPAVTRHGGLTLTVSTGGQSCRRAKLIKQSLARHIESIETADLVVAGTDHRYLSLEAREPFHLGGPRLERTGAMLMQLLGVHEFMLLNTCNRVEIVAVVSHATAAGGLLCHALGFDRLPEKKFYQLEGLAAWEHSALVCAGILSQTPGENHVAAQMKQALAYAIKKGWAAGMLQEWMASALHISKHMKNDVVPDIPVFEIEDLAMLSLNEFNQGIQNKTVLIIGSGMVGRSLAGLAVQAGARIIWCYHRHPPKIPAGWSGSVALYPFQKIKDRLKQADAVVCAAEAPGYVLHGDHVPFFDNKKKIMLIDLGVPRNIAPVLARHDSRIKIMDMEALKHAYGAKRGELDCYINRCQTIAHAHREHYEKLMQSFQGRNA